MGEQLPQECLSTTAMTTPPPPQEPTTHTVYPPHVRMLRSLSVLLLVQVAAASSTLPGQPSSSSSTSSAHHLRLPFGLSVRGGEDSSTNVATATTTPTSAWNTIPVGGASSSSSYSSELESVKATVWKTASESIEVLRQKIVNEGAIVEKLGSKADDICNKALEDFAKNAPDGSDYSSSAADATAYDQALETLEATLDAPLHVLFMKQLSLLREQSLVRYRSAAKTSGASEYEAMLQADSLFVRQAEESTRDGSDWDYTSERSYLQSVMNSIAESAKKATDVQLKSAQQQQTAMQFLQQQQQMIQQLQMQLYGQTSPWNVGVAYRIPDTNFNLQGSYQQGKANIQLSCVPDEYASFLGPNGFTNGVGPGNLGLSINLSV